MVKEVVQDFQTSVLQVKTSQKGEIHQEGANSPAVTFRNIDINLILRSVTQPMTRRLVRQYLKYHMSFLTDIEMILV